jgi:hypothetical protein
MAGLSRSHLPIIEGAIGCIGQDVPSDTAVDVLHA